MSIFPGFGTSDFTLGGKPLTPHEQSLAEARPGDRIPGGRSQNLINNLNSTGLERVAAFRASGAPPPAATVQSPDAPKPQGKQNKKRSARIGSQLGGGSVARPKADNKLG
jgi:hypothetical protein